MSYSIEVVSLGENLYSHLEASVKALNAVQHEFQFHICSNAFREWALAFQRTEYSTVEIWEFLQTYETRVGGKRPLIIAFLNARLGSSEYSNLFGSHEAKQGLAVATMNGYTRFVSDAVRFCSYYLIRYSLSFVNPSLKSHNDPARKDCYFHKKLFKPDIRASMYSGHICDDCMRELDKHWNPAEHEALKKMRAVVSNQYPNALIMKGGGVKGLAFAGALLELERYFLFDLSVGTSAGAIAFTFSAKPSVEQG